MRGAEYIELVAAKMLEKELQAQVVEMARVYGFRYYHTHDSRRSPGGFPDLVLVKEDRLIFAELKTMKGPFRPGQREWLKALEPVAEVYVWRPNDLLAGTIQNTLSK